MKVSSGFRFVYSNKTFIKVKNLFSIIIMETINSHYDFKCKSTDYVHKSVIVTFERKAASLLIKYK